MPVEVLSFAAKTVHLKRLHRLVTKKVTRSLQLQLFDRLCSKNISHEVITQSYIYIYLRVKINCNFFKLSKRFSHYITQVCILSTMGLKSLSTEAENID